MPNCSSKLSFRIFADDTNVFYATKNVNELQTVMNEEFEKILLYCKTNKLSVNLNKTNFMLITNKKLIPQISIANIERKPCIKYLGVYLDEKMNWSYQIKHVNNKLAKNLGILSKLRYYLNLKTMKQIYYNLIFPYLNYALLSWGNTHKTKLTKIITKQNKAVKLMLFARIRENASPYYTLLEILPINNLIKLKAACFTYQIINNPSTTPESFHDYLQLASNIHNYNTRYASNKNIQRPKARTQFKLQTFKFYASQLWEAIPNYLKESKTLTIFKKEYKLFLITSI